MSVTLTGVAANGSQNPPQVSAPAAGDGASSGPIATALQKIMDLIAYVRANFATTAYVDASIIAARVYTAAGTGTAPTVVSQRGPVAVTAERSGGAWNTRINIPGLTAATGNVQVSVPGILAASNYAIGNGYVDVTIFSWLSAPASDWQTANGTVLITVWNL